MPREREFQLSSPAAYSLKCREDDDDALAHVRRKFFDKYGRYFVVRYGSHRMQTFHHVVQEIRHDIEGLRVAMLKVSWRMSCSVSSPDDGSLCVVVFDKRFAVKRRHPRVSNCLNPRA